MQRLGATSVVGVAAAEEVLLEDCCGPGMIAVCLVGVQPLDVHSDGGQRVLHMGLGQSAVAAVAGAVAVDELVDRSFDPGAGAVGAQPLRVLLVMAVVGLALVQVVGQEGDGAAVAGAGAAVPVRARVA